VGHTSKQIEYVICQLPKFDTSKTLIRIETINLILVLDSNLRLERCYRDNIIQTNIIQYTYHNPAGQNWNMPNGYLPAYA